MCVPTALAAQDGTGGVTGTVTSGQAPLSGVTVTVVGTSRSTVTAPNGRYTLTGVPVGPRQVRATRIGYGTVTQNVTVAAGENATANLTLSTSAVQLEGVVAVGYGTQQRRNVASAVSVVSPEVLENTPVTTIDQVLQGTAPGVQVTTASSEPGGALSIRIRGTSSLTGNAEPLYVIDGFPIENDIEGSAVGNGGRSRTTPPNPLATLNPSDVESISILKDASATAIYGARGANGVVIITTKQGRGTKPTFSVDYYTGSQTVTRQYDLLNAREYMDYANTFGQNSSQAYTPFPDSVYRSILASGIDTDWQDQVFRQGGLNNLQLAVRGATTNASPTRYSLSGGFFDQDGVVVGSGLSRYSARINLNQSIGRRVELGGSFSASQARSKAIPTAGQQNANAGAVSAALQYVPILPVRLADGRYSYINRDLNAYNALLDAPQTPNPVSLTNEVRDSLRDTRLLGNAFAQVELLDGLDLRVSLGADYADRSRLTYYPRTTLRGEQANGEAIRAGSSTNSWLNENTLTYERNFNDRHDVTLLGGYTRQFTNVAGQTLSNSDFASDITGYFDIGSGTVVGGADVSSRST
ncbi:MAG TPA: SusC/RagA family TonB-linked outer membrane protein, partial [Longimicrobium sp.]